MNKICNYFQINTINQKWISRLEKDKNITSPSSGVNKQFILLVPNNYSIVTFAVYVIKVTIYCNIMRYYFSLPLYTTIDVWSDLKFELNEPFDNLPMQSDWPRPTCVVWCTASYVRVPERETMPEKTNKQQIKIGKSNTELSNTMI